MYGFKIHMAGTFKEESHLGKIDGKNAVRFRDTVVIGTGDLYSFARAGNKFWAIVQTPGHHTAILLDEYGIGTVPCSINDLSAYEFGEEFLQGAKVNDAVSLCDLDASDIIKEEILDSVVEAMKDMDNRIGNRSPLFTVTNEEFEDMFHSYIGTLEHYRSAIEHGIKRY